MTWLTLLSCSLGVGLFPIGEKPAHYLRGHGSNIMALARTSDGKFLLSASMDRTVRIWDLGSRKEVAALKGHRMPVDRFALSPDDAWLVSVDRTGEMWLWDVRRRERVAVFPKAHAAMRGLAFGPDGKSLATSGSDGEILIWDAHKQTVVRKLDAQSFPFGSLLFLEDRLISAGGSNFKDDFKGEIRFWNWRQGVELDCWKFDNHYPCSVELSPDKKHLATCGAEKVVRLWDLETKKNTHSFVGFEFAPGRARFSKDGRTLITSGGINTIEQRGAEIRFWSIADTKLLHTLRTSSVHVHFLMMPAEDFFYTAEGRDIAVWPLKK